MGDMKITANRGLIGLNIFIHLPNSLQLFIDLVDHMITFIGLVENMITFIGLGEHMITFIGLNWREYNFYWQQILKTNCQKWQLSETVIILKGINY